MWSAIATCNRQAGGKRCAVARSESQNRWLQATRVIELRRPVRLQIRARLRSHARGSALASVIAERISMFHNARTHERSISSLRASHLQVCELTMLDQ